LYDLGVDSRIILKESKERGCELNISASKYDPVLGSCENDNEPSGSTEGCEFLD
jgi:hypothetical protein